MLLLTWNSWCGLQDMHGCCRCVHELIRHCCGWLPSSANCGLMCWMSSDLVPAGAWDKRSLAELESEGLLPLQMAMQSVSDPGGASESDETEQVMQMAAMRILSGIALVHEVIDSRKLKMMF